MAGADDRPCVIVGVDGSEESRQALRWALRIADAIGGRVDAIGVWQAPALVFRPPPIEFTHPPEIHMEKTLTATVDAVFGAERPQNLRLLVREGHPAEVLANRGTTAALIVVGSRGLGGFKGLMQGSVSRQVTERATCPVLVVHRTDDVQTLNRIA